MFKMTDFLDTDLPRALATLERITAALDRYTQQDARLDTATDLTSEATQQIEHDKGSQKQTTDEG